MSNSGAQQYFWCLPHQRVETEANMCPSKNRLGPYGSGAEAERALATVQDRNETWDAEDERWEGSR